MARTVQVCESPDALAEAAARHIAASARRTVAARGRFTLSLSGGDSPGETYRRLAAEDVPWDAVHVFWGDERCIPLEQPDNHFTLATETLLGRVPIPAANVHRLRGEAGDPAAAAAEYEDVLRTLFTTTGPPVFDQILLGMGEDGHVASLFPASAGLAERDRWVVDHDVVKRGEQVRRLTLTLPVLTAAREVVFLVSGALKRDMLASVLAGEADVPARTVDATAATTTWFADRAAAAALGRLEAVTA